MAGEPAAVLTVDTDAIAANWRMLAARVAPAACAAVVKADAYGTGIETTVPALAAAGCSTFFVAVPEEGRRVRAVAPGAVVYVLNGLLPGQADAYAQPRLRPVLGSREQVDEWLAFTAATGALAEAALHVDTGMNRLGVSAEDAAACAARLKPALLMSHFVSSEESASPLNRRQMDSFADVRAHCPGIPGSLANSSGIYLGPEAVHDIARPGYALYGGNPLPGQPNPMRPVVGLTAPIVEIRDIRAGDTVGYNAQWTARGARRLATIPVGYADGYPRSASARDDRPGGEAMVGGVRCPFAGRVSMDLIVIDVTDAPADAVRRGAPVQLIGPELPIDSVGASAGTIGYEILTGLGRRYARRTGTL